MNGTGPEQASELPTPEELELLQKKIDELRSGLHRLEESCRKLQALDEKSEIEGGTKNG